MRRREALATGGCLLATGAAGCLETLRREDAWRELVVDPPEGVYVPPHTDETVPYGSTTAVGREITLLATRPHSFWVATGAERSRADVRSRHALHLMVDVRDAETGAIVPAPVTTRIRSGSEGANGDRIDQRDLWPMLSQRMGPHYGDNVPLDDDGTYTATIRIGPTSAEPVGSLGDLEEPTTVDLEFEYEAAGIEGLERRLIDEDEGRGEPDAVAPMGEHDGDRGETAFDGEGATRLGSETGDDTVYSAALVEDDGSGTESSALAVMARTPYNRYPLPFAALSATISRSGERIADGSLEETIDPRYGHYYGAPVDPAVVERGDELSIELETPPQVARHEGYETAFLESTAVTISLGDG
ncbi:iron transporter [Natronorubrum sp. FCH18a]|uniref:iron transporter n=1 Tax=Natronorubrum sp. FCH18a TaxID=3447018 RepID=UPI003F5177D4